MLNKLTKKGIQKKTVLNDRMAFHSECYYECIVECDFTGTKVTTDYQMKSM